MMKCLHFWINTMDTINTMDKYHGIEMSIATLKRRIKEYGLKRINGNYDINTVRVKIRN